MESGVMCLRCHNFNMNRVTFTPVLHDAICLQLVSRRWKMKSKLQRGHVTPWKHKLQGKLHRVPLSLASYCLSFPNSARTGMIHAKFFILFCH